MAIAKDKHKEPAQPSEPVNTELFPPTHSSGYQQARRNWRQDWESVFEQCSDYFVRY